MEGLRNGCLALGPWPGRGAQLQAVFSDSLSVSAPASAPVVFPSSWAAGSCHCWGTCPSPRGHPMGSLAPVSLQHAVHALSLCVFLLISMHMSLSSRLQATASSLILFPGMRGSLGGGAPCSPFSSTRPSLIGQGGWPWQLGLKPHMPGDSSAQSN